MTRRGPRLQEYLKSPDQYLNPEAIYTLSWVLGECLDEEEIDGERCWVVPNLFDKETRSWHFACVLKDFFDPTNKAFRKDAVSLLTRIAKHKDGPGTAFKYTKSHILQDWAYKDALNTLAHKIEGIRRHLESCMACNLQMTDALKAPCYPARTLGLDDHSINYEPGICSRLHRALLLTYHGFKVHCAQTLSGILYRGCWEYNTKEAVEYFEGKPVSTTSGAPDYKGCYKGVPPSSASQVFKQFETQWGKIQITKKDFDNRGGALAVDLVKLFYFGELSKQIGMDEAPVIVLPIYDTWLGGEGYGGLWGCLILTFKDYTAKTTFQVEHLDNLRRDCEWLSSWLELSAMAAISARPIKPPYDLVEHFLRMVIHMQDWERAAVFRRNRKPDDLPLYCYRREANGLSEDAVWERCDADETKCWNCMQENWKRVLKWDCNDLGNGKWTIWSRDLMPELSQDEIDSFGNITCAFEYPQSACVPTDPTAEKLFKYQLIDQQLRVLRTLIPKVRARRAALRSAVSAIMGRNMSHNIGSHVLARYSSKIKKDLDTVTDDDQKPKADHRGDFLAYLQRRMDFLAEVATSDKAFWSQPLSLKEQIARLTYGEQKKRFVTTEDCVHEKACTHHLSPSGSGFKKNHPVILSFITGKESLLASVEYGKPVDCPAKTPPPPPEGCKGGWSPETQTQKDDFWFACPGGEVGVHALYVILENIIRNSARHGEESKKSKSSDTVRIFVHVEDDPSDAKLLKLEIIDPRTNLTPVDGKGTIKGGITDGADFEKAQKEIEELEAMRANSLFEDGKRKKLSCLDLEINSILHDEPFLDESGNPNPHYWGVREMQICAHYLRGYRLTDLEGRHSGNEVLKAGVHDLPGGSYCLKYTLYLHRAKLMAAIVKDAQFYEHEELATKLRQRGIIVMGEEEAKSHGLGKIACDVRGYSFLVVEDASVIPPEKEKQALLPVRTFALPPQDIASILSGALNNQSKGIGWTEPLHAWERVSYQTKRKSWDQKNYWGLDARERCDSESSTSGIWRRVQLDTNESSPWWPFADSHQTMIEALSSNAIAALWIDHPKSLHFERPTGSGGSRLYQVTVPPTDPREPFYRWIHVEAVFHDSPHKEALDAASETLCQELLATAMVRVAVLDERVQSAAETEVREIKLSRLWPSMGVWVPDKTTVNLDAPEKSALQGFLRRPSSHEEHCPIDFIIIHLTVLERLHKDRENKSDTFADTLNNLTSNTRAEHAGVIVVTGRGVPTVTRSDDPDFLPIARYLPVSAILEYLVSRPSKLGLMRVLWNAGRPVSDGLR